MHRGAKNVVEVIIIELLLSSWVNKVSCALTSAALMSAVPKAQRFRANCSFVNYDSVEN